MSPLPRPEPESQEAIDPGDDWQDPINLPNSRELPSFPMDTLGDIAERYGLAVTAAHSTPPDLPATVILGAVSALVAGSVVVEPQDGWREPVNLYTMALAAPGEGKSPVMNEILRPLRKIEADRIDASRATIAEAESARRMAEGACRAAEQAAAKAAPGQRQEAEAEALALATRVATFTVPPVPRIYTTEATPEAIVRLLDEQNGRMAVLSDEGAEWFEMASRYSGNGKSNLGIYLHGFDGTRYVSDRAGSGTRAIERTTLTVCLVAQPVVLNDLGTDRNMRGRGLLARMLWCRPPSHVGYRPASSPPVTDELRTSWDALLDSLSGQAAADHPGVLRLDADAHRAFFDWKAEHEPRLRPEIGDLASITDWASKLPGQVLRLAGILYVLRTGCLSGSINEATMKAALRLSAYYAIHARAVFDEMTSDPITQDGSAVHRWIRQREISEVTVRDVSQSKGWEPDRVRDALDLLQRYGWVRLAKRRPGPGRPSERYLVNPAILYSKSPTTRIVRDSEQQFPVESTPPTVAPPLVEARPAPNGTGHGHPVPAVPRVVPPQPQTIVCPDCRGSGCTVGGNGSKVPCAHRHARPVSVSSNGA